MVALAREGHELAFEVIVERYRRPLHAYVGRLLPDARTEDVVQQAFLNAWSSLAAGAEVRDLKAWLYRVAHNAALNALREKGYDYAELAEALHDDGHQTGVELRAAIRETLRGVARLPDRQRKALLQMAVQGRSEYQVAESLGISEGAVRQLVFRARQSLRSAATAITPVPLARWAAASRSWDEAASTRIAELATGAAGTAGAVAGVAKTAAVVAVAGGLAAGMLGGGGQPAAGAEGVSEAQRGAARTSQASKPRAAGDRSGRREGRRSGSRAARKRGASRRKASSRRRRDGAAGRSAPSRPSRRGTSAARTGGGGGGVQGDRRTRGATMADGDRTADSDSTADADRTADGDRNSNVDSDVNANENRNDGDNSNSREGDGDGD